MTACGDGRLRFVFGNSPSPSGQQFWPDRPWHPQSWNGPGRVFVNSAPEVLLAQLSLDILSAVLEAPFF